MAIKWDRMNGPVMTSVDGRFRIERRVTRRVGWAGDTRRWQYLLYDRDVLVRVPWRDLQPPTLAETRAYAEKLARSEP